MILCFRRNDSKLEAYSIHLLLVIGMMLSPFLDLFFY